MTDGDRSTELIHDLRNRLTIARANIEAFIDGKLAPSPDRLDAVLQSLKQLEALVNELRASHLTAGSAVRPAAINVCELLDREYHAIEAVALAKGVSFSVFRCPVTAHACANFVGDPVRIGQIMTNVLLNAVRFTPHGGSVFVDCSRRAGQLEVTISDSGPGIVPDEIEKIFEPGFRGSASREVEGSGYGLAIAKEFVEAHGGKISVSPAAHGGARLSVRLPGRTISATHANG